jgi:hypothetical protein
MFGAPARTATEPFFQAMPTARRLLFSVDELSHVPQHAARTQIELRETGCE